MYVCVDKGVKFERPAFFDLLWEYTSMASTQGCSQDFKGLLVQPHPPKKNRLVSFKKKSFNCSRMFSVNFIYTMLF